MAFRRTFMRVWQFAPTTRAAVLVAMAAPLWLLSGRVAGFIVASAAAVVVVALIAFDIITMPPRGAIEVRRTFPSTIGVGDSGEGHYAVQSFMRRPVTLTLFDRLPPGIAGVSAAWPQTVTLAAGDATTVPRYFTGAQRGDHALGPVAARVVGRLGLVARTIVTDPGDEIRGIPSIAAVRTYRLISVQHRTRAPGVRAVRPRGEGRAFANLRDYTLGDDPRHIDWKATARRGKLISREYALEQGQQILIAIDSGRLMTQLAGDRARFEYALSSALVFADVAVHSGDAVGVVVFDDEVRRYVAPARGVAAVRAVRDALTAAEARMVEPDYAAAFRTIASRQRNRALIVIFTDVLDARSSHTLIAHLARSTSRHLPLVVALRNDDLVAAASPAGRHATAEVYQAAAAEELLIARETALASMRASGVHVVDVAPSVMTAAVVNRYLEIKARAAL